MSINETISKLASLPAGEKVWTGDDYDVVLHSVASTGLTTDDLIELAEWVRGVQEAWSQSWHEQEWNPIGGYRIVYEKEKQK